MSPENRNDAGVPFRVGAIPGGARVEETWAGANEARDEKLRLRKAERNADAAGLEVRHSDRGYSLIGSDRKPVNGRNDMSLREIEAWIKTAQKR